MESLDSSLFPWLLAFIAVAATLYSSVGHGGASGYLAAMALFGVSASLMKPAALAMNIVVAGLVFARLWRAGFFNARLFWPFAPGSIPLAFLGGAIQPRERAYQYLVAAALLVAAWRLLLASHEPPTREAPHPGVALPVGAGLGFVSGLTGVGGGIFESATAVLALGQHAYHGGHFGGFHPGQLHRWSGRPVQCRRHAAAWWPTLDDAGGARGALVGSELAVRRLAPVRLRQILGVVLVIAAAKMILAA